MNQRIKQILKNPSLLFEILGHRGLLNFIKDEQYLKILYRIRMKKNLNIKDPVNYNEKLQWLKLHNRKEIYTKMVDKYEVKEYVKNIIGEEYIIPTIGIYNKFEDIEFEKLPNQFVIKCTHDSGGIVICKDKTLFNYKKAKKKINKCLKHNFYYGQREWPYKNVKPRVLIEKYMEDNINKSMRDYKFFCFNGEPKLMYISEGLENHATAKISFYDMDFKITDCKRSDYKQLDYTPKKPKNFELMKKFAAILSKNIPHIRVDFYEINEKLYFGELTFFTCSGFMPFESEKWNNELGELININKMEENK